jgi:hypothetical protein
MMMHKTSLVALGLTFGLVLSIHAPGAFAADGSVAGKVTLSPELQKKLQPSAVLYVIARPAGQVGGMPMAVKRFAQPLTFPVQFTVSSADAMLPGTKLEGSVAITARISQSGSATPVNPGDIEGAAPKVKVGEEKLEIKLDKVR